MDKNCTSEKKNCLHFISRTGKDINSVQFSKVSVCNIMIIIALYLRERVRYVHIVSTQYYMLIHTLLMEP